MGRLGALLRPNLAILCRIATVRKDSTLRAFLPAHCHSITGMTVTPWHYLLFMKNFKGGCKKGVLMQYKCMEKDVRKLHGRIPFPSVMYIANIPAGMQLWQVGNP